LNYWRASRGGVDSANPLGVGLFTTDTRNTFALDTYSGNQVGFPDSLRGDFLVAQNWSGSVASLGGGGPGISFSGGAVNGGAVTSSFVAGDRAEWYLTYVSLVADNGDMTFSAAGVYPGGTNSVTTIITQVPRPYTMVSSEIFDRGGLHATERYDAFMDSVQKSSLEALGKMLSVPISPELRDSLSDQLAEKMRKKQSSEYKFEPTVLYHSTKALVPTEVLDGGYCDGDSTQDDDFTGAGGFESLRSEVAGSYFIYEVGTFGSSDCDDCGNQKYYVVKRVGCESEFASITDGSPFEMLFLENFRLLNRDDFIFCVVSILRVVTDMMSIVKTTDKNAQRPVRVQLFKALYKESGHRVGLSSKRRSLEIHKCLVTTPFVAAVTNNTNGDASTDSAPNGL